MILSNLCDLRYCAKTFVCMRVCVFVCHSVGAQFVCVCTCEKKYVCVYVSVCICMCVYACVCMHPELAFGP